MKLRLSSEFTLPDELADALPKGHELHEEDWAKVPMVLDDWATEEQLDPRLEQLRQLVGMTASQTAVYAIESWHPPAWRGGHP